MHWFRNAAVTLGAAVLALALCGAATAQDPPASVEAQIDGLIAYIEASPCSFIRNGTAYGGADAAVHIRDKYDYYRDRIHTAVDFIDLAATRSALSGQLYRVACPGQSTIPSAQWLRAELAAQQAKTGGN